MTRIARTVVLVCAALTCMCALGPSPALAVQPSPCAHSRQRAVMRVVSRFSRALIRNDMTVENRLITPALRARAHSKQIQASIHPKTEQAALSFMLFGPDSGGVPSRPTGYRFLPGRTDCLGAKSLMAFIELFYIWPGESLSLVSLTRTAQGWRISGLRVGQE